MKKTFDKERPLSWSAISSFEWNKEEWYQKYVLKQPQAPNAEMLFGKVIGERLAKEPDFLPCVPRLPVFEHEFRVSYNEIPLIGYADSFHAFSGLELNEYKTGVKEWNQKRADTHGQIDMYLLMHFLLEKINPADVRCKIVWLPTVRTENGRFQIEIKFVPDIEKNIKIFETKRTKVQVLKFATRIEKTYQAMIDYCENHE